MARRSQCSSAGENPLDPNYLPPHYREEYRLAIDALIEADLEGYYGYLSEVNVVDFLCLPEIEYIKCTVREPRQTVKTDRRYVLGDADGSSDTYWPTHSDLDAPELDLGWPQQHGYLGATEITTLVNPSDPEMPSIKEQARKMIRSAQQVVAVAMDMFTDIDIFADIVDAAMRNVAVYVLLDEFNAQHFVAMANNCRVNLDEIKFMRVRTISGSTYFCHTGKSFKGQMMNRFMLVDCRFVLSGNYSFMWSYEKIHRCIAHLFFGELVSTFDEEFRILFAQSEPLNATNTNTYVDDFPGRQHNIESINAFRKDYPSFKDNCPEWLRHSFDEHLNVGPSIMPLKRGEVFHRSTEDLLPHSINATQQFLGGQPFLEQRRSTKGLTTKEIGSFKGSGHTGRPSYVYAQKNALNIGKDSMEIQSHHFPREEYFHQRPGPGYQTYAQPRDQIYHQYDQYSEPDFLSEKNDAVESGDYDHVQRYLQSYPTMEEEPNENVLVPVKSVSRRHNMGPNLACQTSATHLNLSDQKHVFNMHNQRSEPKEGLRGWRINSYLSALQNTGQPDIEDLQSSDSCEDVPYGSQGAPEPGISTRRQDQNWFNKGPTSKNTLPVQQIDSRTFPEITVDLRDAAISPINTRTIPASASESSSTTDGDNKEPKETISFYEEFFRKKANLALPTNSRLRHSLIFNSKRGQENLSDKENALGQMDEDNQSKQSLVVSSIFEKKRHITKKPIQWSDYLKSSDTASDSTQSEDVSSKLGETSEEKKDETTPIQKLAEEPICLTSQKTHPDSIADDSLTTLFGLSDRPVPFLDMNDPECRLRFFKELAAKRKAEQAPKKMSKVTKDTFSKESDKPHMATTSDTENVHALECLKKIPVATDSIPAFTQTQLVCTSKDTVANQPPIHLRANDFIDNSGSQENTFNNVIATTATDAEKIKHKKKLSEDSFLDIAQEEPGEDLSTQTKHTNMFSKITRISSPEFNKLPSVTESGSSSLYQNNTKPHLVDSQVTTSNSITNITSQETVSSVNELLVDVLVSNPNPPMPSLSISAAATHPSKKLNIPEKIASHQLTPVETAQAKHINSTNALTFEHINALQKGLCKNSMTSDFGHAEHSSITNTASSISVLQTDQHPTGLPQISIATETYPFQMPTAGETCHSKHLIAKDKCFSQILTSKETCPSQLHTTTVTCPSQLPTAKETCNLKLLSEQHPSETSMATVKLCTVKETDPPQQIFATEASQQPTSEPEFLQHCTSSLSQCIFARETGTSTVTDSGSAQNPSLTKTGLFQQSIATETLSKKTPTATETDHFQQLSATKTDTSQTSPETDTEKHNTKTSVETGTILETWLSQQPTAMATDSFKHSSTKETGPFKHVSVIMTGSSPDSPETDTSNLKTGPSQHNSPTKMEPSKQMTKTETNSFQNDSDPSQHVSSETNIGNLKHSNVTEYGPSQQPSFAMTGFFQQSTATETDHLKIPTATKAGPCQHVSATMTDSPQDSPETEAETLEHPPVIETDPFQHVFAVMTDIPQTDISTITSNHSTVTETYCLLKSDICPSKQFSAEISDTSQPSPETDTEMLKHLTGTLETWLSKHATAIETDSSSQEAGPLKCNVSETDTDYLKNKTVPETEPSQNHSLTETEYSICSFKNDYDSSQHVSVVKSDCSQCPPETDTGNLKHSSVTEDGPSQCSTFAKTGLVQQSTDTETDYLQIQTAAETDHCQHVSAEKTEFSQDYPDTETGTLEHPLVIETDPSQCVLAAHQTDISMITLNHSTVIETGSFESSTATESLFQNYSDPSEHLSTLKSNSSQSPPETDTENLKHSSVAETLPLQHPSVGKKGLIQQSTETVTDSLLIPTTAKSHSQHTAKTDTTQNSSKTIAGEEHDPLQNPLETKAGPSIQPTDNDKYYLTNLTGAETNISQQLSKAKIESSQDPPETETCPLENTTLMDTCFSQHVSAAKTDIPQHCPENVLKHSTVMDTCPSQFPTATETDSLLNLAVTETCPLKHFSVTKTDTSQLSTETDTGTLNHPTEISVENVITSETELSQHTALEIDSLQHSSAEHSSEANTGNSELSSINHTKAEEENPNTLHCIVHSMAPLPRSPCLLSKSLGTETHSYEESKQCLSIKPTNQEMDPATTPPQEECKNPDLNILIETTPVISTTETDILSECSSNSDKELCSSEQLKKDELKNGKPKKEETQQQVEIAVSVTAVAEQCNDDNEVDKIKDNTEQVESPAELKAETCQTSSSVYEQSLTTENSTCSSHQPSAVNLLSCSNLRDDTKVLLEQISAKNQEKATKTLSVNDNLKLDKPITLRHWNQTWSAKASPEEREELLQKMEKKRKDKIYSRFEVP